MKHKENHFFNTILSILMGLLVGGILLLVIGVNPLAALKVIILGLLENQSIFPGPWSKQLP